VARQIRKQAKSHRKDAKLRGASKSIVRGRVSVAGAQGAPGLRVTAFDRDMRRWQKVGEATTDAAGAYRIPYSLAKIARAEKGGADLVVKVLDAAGEPLAESPVRFNAGAEEVIDLLVSLPQEALWQRLTSTVVPLLDGQGLLPEALTDADFDFLVAEGALDREQLRDWSWARKAALSQPVLAGSVEAGKTSGSRRVAQTAAASQAITAGRQLLDWQFYFACARQLETRSVEQVFAHATPQLVAAARGAVAANLVPAALVATPAALAAAIDRARSAQALAPAAPGAAAKLADVLDTVRPDWLALEQRHKVVELVARVDPSTRDFEAHAVKAGLAAGDARVLTRTLRLAQVTENRLPVMAALQPFVAKDADASLAGLARLTTAQWLDLAHSKGTTEGQGRAAAEYAARMRDAAENAVPEVALRSRVEAGELQLSGAGFASVARFLANNPAFSFTDDDVDGALDGANLDGIEESAEQIGGALRQLQALKRAGVRWEEVPVFLDAGLGSLEALAQHGRAGLVNLLGSRLDAERVEVVAQTAMTMRMVGVGLLGQIVPLMRKSGTDVMEPRHAGDEARKLIEASPSLRSLFGALEQCGCDPCQSVLSPSAYLVDLLKFVARDNGVNWQFGQRRADIYDLELSCDNAQIELPHIDLVNEILENAVALPFSIELPGVQDPVALLQQRPIPAPILAALQSTTWETLHEPTMLVEIYPNERTEVTRVVISDRYRRWGLELRAGYFGTAGGGKSVLVPDPEIIAQVLDNGRPPPDPDGAFTSYLETHARGIGKLPLRVEDLRVTPIVPGERWEISYVARGEAAIDEHARTLRLAAHADAAPQVRSYSSAALGATRTAFGEGQLGGMMLAETHDSSNYEVSLIDAASWRYSKEVREVIVLIPAGVVIRSLSYQCTARDRDLATRPQHRNPRAYREFLSRADAVYPWTLPFDVDLAETRVLLDGAGLGRAALMEKALPDASAPRRARLALERLSMSQAELGLATGAAAGDALWKIWGLKVANGSATIFDTYDEREKSGAPLELLSVVSLVLQQARLEFRALESLLQSEFVNPGRTARIDLPAGAASGAECDPTKLIVKNNSPALLDRLHRFARWQRRLRWTVPELDFALRARAAQPAATADDTAEALAEIEALRVRLNVPVETLLTAFYGFDRTSYAARSGDSQQVLEPLYERTFQNPRTALAGGGAGVTRSIDAALAFAALTNPASALTIGDRAASVAACVGLRAHDVLPLLNAPIPPAQPAMTAATLLTVGHLQQLVACAALTRALHVSPTRLATLLELIGRRPFESPRALSGFCQAVDFLGEAGADAERLRYVLTHRGPQSFAWIFTEDRGRQTLLTLQRALLAAAAQIDTDAAVEIPADSLATLLDNATAMEVRFDILRRLTQLGRSQLERAVLSLWPVPGDAFANAARVRELVDAAVAWQRRVAVVVPVLAQATGVDAPLVHELLWHHLRGVSNAAAMELFADPKPRAPDQRFENPQRTFEPGTVEALPEFQALLRVYKFGLLNASWRLSLGDLARFPGSVLTSQVLAGLSFDTLPVTAGPGRFDDWRSSTALLGLTRARRGLAAVVDDYTRAIWQAAGDPVAAGAAVWAAALDLPVDSVRELAGAGVLEFGAAGAALDSCREPLRLTAWYELLLLARRYALSGADVRLLIAAAPDRASIDVAVRALRSYFGESQWRERMAKAANALRVEQRDRLVDYLLWRDGLRDADGLYERYLIDPQMAPCMNTTRLLQAIAAVQLFVHRCLMKLERFVDPADVDPDREWQWRKNYRVWEANRKIFLFPENWLHPELRDDKSEIFRSFETALLQAEASDASVANAVQGYLEALVDVSHISIMGMYEETPRARTNSSGPPPYKTLHVVGRSPDPPYTYFYRRNERNGAAGSRWTPWERISLDLPSCHVVPFVLGGELHLVWPNIELEKDATDNLEYYNITIAWARRTSLGWTQRKVAMESATRIQKHLKRDERGSVALKLSEPQSGARRAVVELYVARKTPSLIDEASLKPNRVVMEYTPGQGPGVKSDHVATNISRWTFSVRAYLKFRDTRRIERVNDCTYTILGLRLGGLNDPAAALGVYIFGNSSGPYLDRLPLPPAPGFPADGTPLEFSVYNYEPEIAIEAKAVIDGTPTTITTPAMPRFGGVAYQGTGTFDVDIMFEIEKDPDFDDPGVNEFARVKMDRVGCFWFETGRDTRWILDSTHAPMQLPIETLSWESRLREREDFAAQEMAGLHDGSREVFPKSFGSTNYLALRAAKTAEAAAGADTWYWEESAAGATSRFVRLLGAGAAGSLVTVQPGGYEDAHEYRYRYAVGREELFTPDAQDAPANTRFGVDRVAEYFPANLPAGVDARSVPLLPFHLGMPYGSYNWEVFYHLPMAAARFLFSQQRYEEAQRWFSYVFDPTTNDPAVGRERYWRCLPLRHSNTPLSIQQLVRALSDPNADPAVKHMVEDQVAASIANAFSPFAVARERNSAYEWYAVIAYVRNLIEWGDSLFRRDTRESINEAAMLYVFASRILGRRPENIPRQGYQSPPLSYRALLGRWDVFGNAWARLIDTPAGRALIALLIALKKAIGGINPQAFDQQIAELASVGALYFCVPENEKLLELWDDVADRLWKIRHCENIDGVRRPLALLDPPIDPELLIRARLAGVDIDDVLADLHAPPPNYRYAFLAQKALELCAELKGLGAALLSAIEKKDGERLALLRQTQEITMLGLVEAVRLDQVSEAEANIAALRQSRQNSIARYRYLQRLLGNSDIRFDAQGVPILDQHGSLQVRDANAPAGFRGLGLVQSEVDQIAKMQDAHTATMIAGVLKAAGALGHASSAVLYAYGLMTEPAANALRGVADGLSVGGDVSNLVATDANHSSQRSSLMASFQRRREDWIHQSEVTVDEVRQIDRQIIAAEVRRDIARKELANHRRSLEHARDIDDYLRQRKFSTAELFAWMETQLLSAYHGAYQLAFDLAKRAERAWRRELGENDSQWVRYGYWEGARKGLLAGEQLGLDLHRMQMGYLERSKREYEITRHVSVATLDPAALVLLRENGSCTVSIPEALFDLDFPGHYFRRLKLVSVSLPCVVGPYASVPVTLKLLRSSLRTTADAGAGYAREEVDDDRFEDVPGGTEAVVTSTGQNDSGLFEANMRDERFLPFENAGAISTWQLDLPDEFRAFDYGTISDVIIHLRYTAREGGDDLKTGAVGALRDSLNSFVRMDSGEGLTRMLSLRQDFPAEWHRLTHPADETLDASVDLAIGRNRFPYLFSGARIGITIGTVDAYAVPKPGVDDAEFPAFVALIAPNADDDEPLQWGTSSPVGPLLLSSAEAGVPVVEDEAAVTWTVTVPSAEITVLRDDFSDLLLVFHYALS